MRVRVTLDEGDVRIAVRDRIRDKVHNIGVQYSDVKFELHPVRWRRKHPRANPVKRAYVDVNA